MRRDCGADERGLRRVAGRRGSAAGHVEHVCANVSVVNIDNGFGAACIASLINHL